MALKGIKPEVVKPQKPKILITGPAGSRKSSFVLNAPAPFYIDTESGITREQYQKSWLNREGCILVLQKEAKTLLRLRRRPKNWPQPNIPTNPLSWIH